MQIGVGTVQRGRWWIGWLLALALPGSIAHAASLNKSTAWVASYEPDGCHVSAKFGAGESAIIAELTRYRPGSDFDLVLIGKKLYVRGVTTNVKLDFGQGAAMDRAPALNGTRAGLSTLIMSSVRFDGWRSNLVNPQYPPQITSDQEAKVNSLSVELADRRRFQLRLGAMDKPMAELRKCTDVLLAHWGYDPNAQATLSRYASPTNSPATWLVTSDYPRDALAASHSGLVRFRLDVGEQGQILGCHIIAQTIPGDFSELTCRLVSQRARMQPALDAKGAPIRSYFVQQVRWLAG